jgi:hypothetical protein
MASTITCTVVVTPDGVLTTATQYLFSPYAITRIKPATAKQIALYPTVHSVIGISRAQNNAHETVDYLVTDTMATLAGL